MKIKKTALSQKSAMIFVWAKSMKVKSGSITGENFKPESVIDVGCGTGPWARQYIECGVRTVIGVDGDYVNRKDLLIPDECFFGVDLNVPEYLAKFGKFDLVNCLEVAEHLKPNVSGRLVMALTKLSDCIFFGAAIPQQGGTNHINEAWQSSWAEKFTAQGYRCIDALRPRFWDKGLEWWYAQNSLVFVKEEKYKNFAHLGEVLFDAIHPQHLQIRLNELHLLRAEIHSLRATLNSNPKD